jgi:hypothetical protein
VAYVAVKVAASCFDQLREIWIVAGVISKMPLSALIRSLVGDLDLN